MNEHGRMGETLRRMSRRNRASFLKSIVKQLDSSDAQYLLELVRHKLTIDPLSKLPVELQFKVLLSIIDPLTMLRMACACKAWKTLVFGDKLLWKKFLRRMRLSAPAKELLLAAPNTTNDTVSLAIRAIKFEIQLKRSWQQFTFKRETIAAHGASVITCLHLDELAGRLISGADNGAIGVWNLHKGGANIMQLVGHQGGVWALAADDEIIVTGSTDKTLIIWDVKTGTRKYDLIGHSSTVRCVELIKDSYMIVSGSRDGTVRVWDKRNGQCLHVLAGHGASVRCLASWKRPDGQAMMISGSYDGTLRVWDLQNGECKAVCDRHDGKIYSVVCSKNYIFSGGMDAKIKVWRPEDGELVDVFSDHSGLVGLLEIRNGILVAGSTDGSLSLWNVDTLERIRHIELAHSTSITAINLNRYAVISGSERSLQMWSLDELIPASHDGENSEPAEYTSLSDKMDVIWRISMGELYGAIAYQQAGISRMDILNFHP